MLRCFLKKLSSDGFCSERGKAYCRKFEELFSERDPDYGDTPKDSAEKSGEGDFPTEKYYPEDVEKRISEFNRFADYFFFERKGANSRNFKALDSRGKSDYSYAKKNSGKSPFKPKRKSAEYEPKDVTESFQLITFSL